MFGSNTFGFGTQTFGAQAPGTAPTFGSPAGSTLFGGSGTSQPSQFGTQPGINFGNVSSQFGTAQPSLGSTQQGFGTNQQGFASGQQSFGTTQGFGANQQGFGTSQQQGFGTAQQGFGTTQQAFPSGQQTFGLGQQGFGSTQQGFGTSFGTSQQGFGTSQSSFGSGQQGFGTAQTGFGTSQQGFGTSQQGFGSTQQGFLGQQGFGTTQQGFGTTQQGFGSTQQGFGGGGQQSFGTAFGTTGTTVQSNVGFGGTGPTNFQFSTPASTTNTFQPTQTSSTPFGSTLTSSSGLSFGVGSTAQSQPGFGLTPVSVPFAMTGSTSVTTAASGITFGTSLSSPSKPPTSAASTGSGTFTSRQAVSKTSKPSGTSTSSLIPATSKPTTNLGGGDLPVPLKVGKENVLPTPLLDCVNAFKNFVKVQKTYSSEVSRASLQPIKKVSEDIDMTKHLFTKLERNVIRNQNLNKKVKSDTIRGLSDCEIAQSTVDLPGNFQTNHASPYEYFSQLGERFQDQATSLRLQVEDTEKHISCVLNPSAFTPQELSISLQRLHESFVALAGRMQNLHSSVISLVKQHRGMQKKKVTWPPDLGESTPHGRLNSGPLPGPSPTPFSGANNYHVLNMWAMKAKQEQANALSKIPVPPGGTLIPRSPHHR